MFFQAVLVHTVIFMVRLNFVRFTDLSAVEALSLQLGDDTIIVDGTARQALVGNFKVRFLSCMVIEKRGNSDLQRASKDCDIVAVRGSSPEMCSWAANAKGIGLLLQPFSAEKCFLDLQTANVLRDNGIFVGFLFSDFLECEDMRQAQLIKNASMALKILTNAGVGVLFFSGAKNLAQMRASKDMSSLGVLFGMGKEDALKVVRENPAMFLERAAV